MNFNENPQGNAILDSLRAQRSESRFCDIVLHVYDQARQERLFPAHRSVLAASSPYFESVLKTNRVTKEQININGCHDVDVFETLLDYMYTGNITVDWNNVNELLKLSNHFLIVKVSNYCCEFLEHYLSLENCLEVRELAEKYNLDVLQKVATDFMAENLGEILEQPYMFDLAPKKLDSIIVNDPVIGFAALPGSQVLAFLVAWVKKDVPKRSVDYSRFIDSVDWENLKVEFIHNHLDTETLFQESPLCLYYTLKSLNKSNVPLGNFEATFKNLEKMYADKENSHKKGRIGKGRKNKSASDDAADENSEEAPRPNSPIVVEPFEYINVTRSGKKTAAIKKEDSGQNGLYNLIE